MFFIGGNMKIKKDLSGQLFGKWLVVSPSLNIGKNVIWKCRCVCGKTKDVYAVHQKQQ